MFTPEVVVFHLFLHQFCPVGGKVCVCVCWKIQIALLRLKRQEGREKEHFLLFMAFFSKLFSLHAPGSEAQTCIFLLKNLNYFIFFSAQNW